MTTEFRGHKQSMTDLAHRIGVWAGMIGLMVYVMNIGTWVGAADEKFKDAESVEQTQQQIKERLARLEEQVEDNDERSADRDKLILEAISRLEDKIDTEIENDNR